MSEAWTPFGYVRGISSVSLMLMVKIESFAIGSAFERGPARGRRLYARIPDSKAEGLCMGAIALIKAHFFARIKQNVREGKKKNRKRFVWSLSCF